MIRARNRASTQQQSLAFLRKRTNENGMGTASSWTPERRAKQAEAIRRWKPWDKSTGPRTEEGKARSSRNADKGITEFEAIILNVSMQSRAASLAKAEVGLRNIASVMARLKD